MSASSRTSRCSPACRCTRRTAAGIAFADNFAGPGEKDVWVMNADGSGLRQVTNTPDLELPRSWSPDGTRVAADFVGMTQAPGARVTSPW